MAFAIIKTGGRQYRVAEGDTIDVDLLEAEPGKQVVIAEVLMHADGDKLTHQIIQELNGTFVTPLDREDIVGLASKLDDVTDVCYDVAEMISLYKVSAIRPAAVRQVQTLVQAAQEVVVVMRDLEKLRGLEPHWIKVHTLENEGDAIYREAVADLFARTTDPVEVIKWKDIHGLIEVAVDRCEDVANIVEMIVVKHK